MEVQIPEMVESCAKHNVRTHYNQLAIKYLLERLDKIFKVIENISSRKYYGSSHGKYIVDINKKRRYM